MLISSKRTGCTARVLPRRRLNWAERHSGMPHMYAAHAFMLDYMVTFLPQTDGLVRKDPLTHRQILAILENLYDVVLKVEQLRRDQPSESDVEAFQTW
jgi:hypothetical protein